MQDHINALSTEILAYGSPAYLLKQDMTAHAYDLEAWEELEGESYLRAVVGSGWYSSTGLSIPDGATEADMLVAMRASRTLHTSDAWVRGDIINWLRDNKFGGGEIPHSELDKIAAELGVASSKRLLNNATTARAWPQHLRHPAGELSYSHHEELNALPEAEKRAWAERAIAESLTIAALRALLNDDSVSIGDVEVSVDGAGGAGAVTHTEQVTFASEKLDKKQALDVIANAIAVEFARKTKGSTLKAVAASVLLSFMQEGMLRLPAKAWKDAFANLPAQGAGGEQGAVAFEVVLDGEGLA